MNREDHRQAVYEIAKTVAPGWERQRERIEKTVAPVRRWMINELATQPGDTVLELAAGAGDTGFEAAAMAGERGRLISTDFSPEMLEVARRRGARLGLRHVEYRVMDAERIDLDAHSADRVICRFGYMLMADPAAALRETRRVLRAPGRLALAVWSAPERNPWITILGRLVVERGYMAPPEPASPDPFSMASEERTRALLSQAGFTAVRTAEVPVRFAFRDLEDYLSHASDTAGACAVVLRGLPENERSTLKEQLGKAFERFVTQQGYELPGVALTAVAS
jgi:ubiquinone/menaquinone biosynthesis C-methylase UbiE